MLFRRQDIPRTTRKADDGSPRRLYPRFIRDKSLLPKVDLTIGYLDGMVGRTRAELSPDPVLDLFGDPRLARCVLACLADTYRYHTPSIAEAAGEEIATALVGWDLLTPTDLRDHVYRAVNAEQGGFVTEAERATLLARLADPLGLTGEQLDRLLHLDAERNAILTRQGGRPDSEDVVARYNVILGLSTLRQSSSITLDLPGLERTTIEAICARHEVEWRRTAEGGYRLAGRRDAAGSWVRFGGRLARCAFQLLLLAPRTPTGFADVQLKDQTLRFVLDSRTVPLLRRDHRAAADADGTIRTALLASGFAALRRQPGSPAAGWTVRRPTAPLVVEGAVVLPELTFSRGQTAVPLVPVPTGCGQAAALAAVERVNTLRPTIALGVPEGATDAPSLPTADPERLLALLDRLDRQASPIEAAVDRLAAELTVTGWVEQARLTEGLPAATDAMELTRPLTETGEAALVPGFGLCRTTFLDRLLDEVNEGPVDVTHLRTRVADEVGEGPGADALTLHLLSSWSLIAASPLPGRNERERAA